MQNSGAGFKRTYAGQSIPVFMRDKALELEQGGFNLVLTGLSNGQVIPRGTPIIFNEATRQATLGSFGKVYANASNSATAIQVAKGHNLIVGGYLAASTGGAAYAITAIDTTNAAYDTVTIGTTLGVAVVAGQTLFASTATGATAAALPAFNGLLYEETYIDTALLVGVSAVIRGTVYARRTYWTAQLAALPGLAHIIYSQSY
ncbi:MAG: hypothetical protein ABI067_07025 [Leifsonia sp.]